MVESDYSVSYTDHNGKTQTLMYRTEMPLMVRQVLRTGDAWRGPAVIVREILEKPRIDASAGTVRAELWMRHADG